MCVGGTRSFALQSLVQCRTARPARPHPRGPAMITRAAAWLIHRIRRRSTPTEAVIGPATVYTSRTGRYATRDSAPAAQR